MWQKKILLFKSTTETETEIEGQRQKQNVFKGRLLQRRQQASVSGKGLIVSIEYRRHLTLQGSSATEASASVCMWDRFNIIYRIPTTFHAYEADMFWRVYGKRRYFSKPAIIFLTTFSTMYQSSNKMFTLSIGMYIAEDSDIVFDIQIAFIIHLFMNEIYLRQWNDSIIWHGRELGSNQPLKGGNVSFFCML